MTVFFSIRVRYSFRKKLTVLRCVEVLSELLSHSIRRVGVRRDVLEVVRQCLASQHCGKSYLVSVRFNLNLSAELVEDCKLEIEHIIAVTRELLIVGIQLGEISKRAVVRLGWSNN